MSAETADRATDRPSPLWFELATVVAEVECRLGAPADDTEARADADADET